MKLLFLFFILGASIFSQADSLCGGTCVNASKHEFVNRVCQNAVYADSDGQSQCEQFSMLGCKWIDYTKAEVRRSFCLNGSKDRTLDTKCRSQAANLDDRACVATTGCVWVPAAYTCRR